MDGEELKTALRGLPPVSLRGERYVRLADAERLIDQARFPSVVRERAEVDALLGSPKARKGGRS